MTQSIEIVEKPDICSIKDCGSLGQYMTQGKVWSVITPKDKRTDANCAHIDIGLSVCSQHIEHLQQDRFMTDDLWNTITSPFRQNGWPMPDRSSLILTVKPLPTKPKEQAQ